MVQENVIVQSLGEYCTYLEELCESPVFAETLGGERLFQEYVISWGNDVEHGMCHGFISGFFVWLLNRRAALDEYVLSSLVHDFYKVNFGHDFHDMRLVEFFPHLVPSVYTHINPSVVDDPIVISDRMELARYPDWKTWCDQVIWTAGLSRYDATLNIMGFYERLRFVYADAFAMGRLSEANDDCALTVERSLVVMNKVRDKLLDLRT